MLVVEHGARRLRQVVERGVAAQRGRQRRGRRALRTRRQRRGAARARRQRALQALGEVADRLPGNRGARYNLILFFSLIFVIILVIGLFMRRTDDSKQTVAFCKRPLNESLIS